jgi:hypothetical protein
LAASGSSACGQMAPSEGCGCKSLPHVAIIACGGTPGLCGWCLTIDWPWHASATLCRPPPWLKELHLAVGERCELGLRRVTGEADRSARHCSAPRPAYNCRRAGGRPQRRHGNPTRRPLTAARRRRPLRPSCPSPDPCRSESRPHAASYRLRRLRGHFDAARCRCAGVCTSPWPRRRHCCVSPVLASRGGQHACTVHFLAVLTCSSLGCFALSLKAPNVGRSGRGISCQFSSRRCMGPLALSPRQTPPSTARWACLLSREMRHVAFKRPQHTHAACPPPPSLGAGGLLHPAPSMPPRRYSRSQANLALLSLCAAHFSWRHSQPMAVRGTRAGGECPPLDCHAQAACQQQLLGKYPAHTCV